MFSSSRRFTRVCCVALASAGLLACAAAQPTGQPIEVVGAPEAAPQAADREPSPVDFDAGKLLELTGGPALGCEARGVGDWVRVRCSDLSYLGAPPWRASVDDASSGIQPKLSQRLGDVQLSWRHTEGSTLHASFIWFPHIVRMRSEWPKGSPRPQIVARFVNVPTRSAKEIIHAACECPPRLGPDLLLKSAGYSCESPSLTSDGIDAWEPECMRQLELDCQEFNECLTHEPSGGRPCADDEHPTGLGAFTSCHKKCDDTRRCPSGFSCEDAYEQAPMGDPPAERPFACFPTDDAQTEYLRALNAYLEQRSAR